MPNDRFAEILLESVTTRERALSTLGDLRETAAARGELWFWGNVIATAASLSWRTLADAPRSFIGLAFRGWLVCLGLTLLIVMASLLVSGVAMGALANHSGVGAAVIGGTAFVLTVLPLLCVVLFVVGRWIARRAPGREIAACLAFTILQGLIEYTFLFAVIKPEQALIGSVGNLICHVFCFLGAISVRPRAQHHWFRA